jgi:SPP1 gp7 family putative phage head morphogenesis protein
LARLRSLRRPAPFKPTAASVKVYRAVISDKVALIDRLPSKYRSDVQELVWDAVMRGYDVPGLARELHDRFGIATKRAQSIARSQCRMARSVIDNAQWIEAGLKEAVWNHDTVNCVVSNHRALHGKRYVLARGVDLDGRRVWPGSEPECFCGSSEIATPESNAEH